MSECHESAQLLAGPELPTVVLEALLSGSTFSGKTVAVVNLSPYDGHLERVALKWKMTHGEDAHTLRSFSLGMNIDHVSYSERVVANQLLQDCLEHTNGLTCKNQQIRSKMLMTKHI